MTACQCDTCTKTRDLAARRLADIMQPIYSSDPLADIELNKRGTRAALRDAEATIDAQQTEIERSERAASHAQATASKAQQRAKAAERIVNAYQRQEERRLQQEQQQAEQETRAIAAQAIVWQYARPDITLADARARAQFIADVLGDEGEATA